jgi:Allene oxide cyclase barrel like domain
MLRRAILLLAVAAASAVAAPGAARAETLTIQLTSVVITIKPIDVRPKGTSKGDRIIERNKLTNAVRQFGKPKGTRVGTDQGTLTFTSPHSARFVGVARLPGGTLKLKGTVRAVAGNKIRIPVTGGTGRYASAVGTLTVGPGERKVLNVYQLTLPGTIA